MPNLLGEDFVRDPLGDVVDEERIGRSVRVSGVPLWESGNHLCVFDVPMLVDGLCQDIREVVRVRSV